MIPYQGDYPLPASWISMLDALNGTNANGVWTLVIDDDTAGGVGVLHSWSLELNGATDPAGPSDAFELCTSAAISNKADMSGSHRMRSA